MEVACSSVDYLTVGSRNAEEARSLDREMKWVVGLFKRPLSVNFLEIRPALRTHYQNLFLVAGDVIAFDVFAMSFRPQQLSFQSHRKTVPEGGPASLNSRYAVVERHPVTVL